MKTATALALIMLFANSHYVQSQEASAEPANIAEKAPSIADAASKYKIIHVISGPQTLEVTGDYVVNTWWIGAEKIKFAPGSKLVISSEALKSSREVYIFAKSIEVDPANPPIITWMPPNMSAPGDRGQAKSGANGSGVGANGAAGTDGASGTTGERGFDAPSVVLMFMNLSPGPLRIEMNGSSGGIGSKGQRGGDGGYGARGSAAQQDYRDAGLLGKVWLPACSSGPGKGGSGGAGGAGGQGGIGGVGGSGGSVTLISIPEALPTLTQAIKIDVEGGVGGAGGAGGDGGSGGQGGNEGQLASFCNSADRHGSAGNSGSIGVSGVTGENGNSGRVYVGSFTREQFRDIFGWE